MKRLFASAALVAAMATPHTASAEDTVANILNFYDQATLQQRQLVETSMSGVENGIAWVNTYLTETRKQPPLYCQPGKLVLTGGQLIQMLRDAVKEKPAVGTIPYGSAVLAVLLTDFPCQRN